MDRGLRRSRLEWLEPRLALAAPSLATIADVTLLAGAPLNIALDGADADGDTLTYTVSSSNASVTPVITPSTNRSLRIQVDDAGDNIHGAMTFQLFDDLAPKTAARIEQLAQAGTYNGLIFHRVIKDFMIQGGDPLGNGTGGTGAKFDDEYNASLRFTGSGLLAMAKSDDDTNDSQFFITAAPTRHLDFNHSIFGMLTEGDAIREAIENVDTNSADKPLNTVTMTKVEVFQDTQNGVLRLSAPKGATGTSQITVNVSDGHGGTATRVFNVTVAADTTSEPPFLLSMDPVRTSANTPVTFTIPATDVNGNARFFSAEAYPANANLEVTANATTGTVTVTPKNGIYGVFPLRIKVASSTQNLASTNGYNFDSQLVPLLVAPSAPVIASMLADSGTGNSNGATSHDNSSAAKSLTFHLTGLLANAKVTLLADGQTIGQGTAAGTSMDLATNGSLKLSAGAHTITATQTLPESTVQVGNTPTSTALTSLASSAFPVTIVAAPSVADFSKYVAAGTVLTFAAADFTGHFTEPSASDSLKKVKITQLPTHGTLNLNGAAVTANQEIVAADLAKLTYQPAQGYQGADTVKWNAADSTGYASADATITINSVPDVPVVSDFSKNVLTGATLTFAATDFTSHFTDPNAAHSLEKVKITQLPAHGTLSLNGAAVAANQEIAAADLGKLAYQSNQGFTGADTLKWNATDGSTYAAAAGTATIAVNANGSISGWVYLDTNSNGQRDASEIGLPGVVMRLGRKDSQGQWVEVSGQSLTMTAADGSYRFENLPAGSYEVRQVVQPSSYLDGKETAGSLGGTVDGDRIYDIALGAGSQATNYLFGELGLRSKMVSQWLFLTSTPAPSQVVRNMNQSPVIDLNGPGTPGSGSTTTFPAAGSAKVIATGATVADPEDGWLSSMTLSLASQRDGDSEVLAANTSGTNLQASYRAGVLTVQGVATTADYQKVLRSVTYQDKAAAPTAGSRTITVTASDGIASSAAATATVTVEAAPSSLAATNQPDDQGQQNLAGQSSDNSSDNSSDSSTDASAPRVVRNGNQVTVTGTGSADNLEFIASAAEAMVIANGQVQSFSLAEVTSFVFDGAGSGFVDLTGSDGAQTARLHPRSATFNGPGYAVNVVNARGIRVTAGNGDSEAELYDSADGDTLTAQGTFAQLAGNDFSETVLGFKKVKALATAGGQDTANLAAVDYLLEKVGDWRDL